MGISALFNKSLQSFGKPAKVNYRPPAMISGRLDLLQRGYCLAKPKRIRLWAASTRQKHSSKRSASGKS